MLGMKPAICVCLLLALSFTSSAAPSIPPGRAALTVHHQLDVCGLHKSMNNAPTSVLEYDKIKNECTIISRSIPPGPSCTANSRDGATIIKMACKADNTTSAQITGPALNIWATYQGLPTASVTLERSPVTSSSVSGTCNLTTLSPPLYYHYRIPPMYSFGYAVQGLKCQLLTSSTDGLVALGRKGSTGGSTAAGVIPLNYGLWLIPSLPGPSQKDFSEAPQKCKVLLKGSAASFVSLQDYPCKLTPLPQPQLGKGCCYDPMGRRRRHLAAYGDSTAVW